MTGYDKGKTFRQSDHTLENIQSAIRGLFPAEQAEGMLTELAGYMVLDALIGNTDRHHENWGLTVQVEPDAKALRLSVAPSFDHASSLGRELRDVRREELLQRDRVPWYVRKGRGGIFRSPDERHGENPLHLVELAARAYPPFFRPSLDRVKVLTDESIRAIVHALPEERASTLAKRFAEAMILTARDRLKVL